MASITYPSVSPASLGVHKGRLERLQELLRTWSDRATGRAALAQMSPAELRDIGLSPEQASWEVNKAPWQA